jgi:hypothetical protein
MLGSGDVSSASASVLYLVVIGTYRDWFLVS